MLLNFGGSIAVGRRFLEGVKQDRKSIGTVLPAELIRDLIDATSALFSYFSMYAPVVHNEDLTGGIHSKRYIQCPE